MSNRKLAITWAIANLNDKNFLVCDQFFEPFNAAVRKGIVRELNARGVEVFSMGLPKGAILARRDSKALTANTNLGGVLTNATGDTVMPVMKYLVNFPL